MTELSLDLSGAGGLAAHFHGDNNYSASSPNLRYQGGSDQVAEGIYNPFKRNGYLAPANFSTKNVADGGSAFFRAFGASLFNANNNEFFIGGKIQLAYGAPYDTSLSSVNGSLLNNNDGYVDLELYQLNGVAHIYALYKASGSASTNIATFPTGTHAWLANNLVGSSGTITNNATLTAGASKLIPADNGYLYVLDTNKIQQIDGTTVGGAAGTLTSPAPILFPSYASMSDGIDFGGNLYIGLHLYPHTAYGTTLSGTNHSSVCGVYIWDRQSTVFGRQSFIITPQAKFIRKIFVSPTGNIRCIVTMTNNLTGILEFNGHAFKTICVLGQNAFPAFIDSATTTAGGIWWQGVDGNMYFYGSPSFEMGEGLYCLGKTSANSITGDVIIYTSGASDYSPATTTGANIIPEGFFLSYLDSGTYYLKKWYLNADSDATNLTTIVGQAGNVYTLVRYLPHLATIKNIKIYCIPNGAAGDATTVATLSFYANQSTTPFKTVTVTRGDISKGYLAYELNKPYVTAFQMKISWDTSQAVSSNDFNPSFASLTYDPTATR